MALGSGAVTGTVTVTGTGTGTGTRTRTPEDCALSCASSRASCDDALAMGNLFDELKKAKLIDKKRAKQLAHEARVEKKTKGGDLAKDEALKQKAEAHESRKAEERRRNRDREAQRQAERQARERRAELKQLVASRRLADDPKGGRRWHFVAENGGVPFVLVDEQASCRLQAGELAIVQDPNFENAPRYAVVPREVAQALAEHSPEAIRFLAGS